MIIMPNQAPDASMLSPLSHRRAARGFTLIELMVVLALVGILVTLAAPSFVQFQRNSRLRTVSSSLVSAINMARSEAMKRQKFTFVMPRDGGWNAGWDVFVDMDNSFSKTDADVKLGALSDKPSDVGVTVATSLPYVMFSGSGFPRTTDGSFLNGTFTLTIPGSGETARSVVLSNTGRVRVCDPNKDGADCPDSTK